MLDWRAQGVELASTHEIGRLKSPPRHEYPDLLAILARTRIGGWPDGHTHGPAPHTL